MYRKKTVLARLESIIKRIESIKEQVKKDSVTEAGLIDIIDKIESVKNTIG